MVSVIVPNYNHAPFLRQRIQSILAQTYSDFELIILDDCSTDNSRAIIEEYRSHPKVSHVVFNEHNSGSTFKQWNKGISLAKAEWIWIAESDDNAEHHFLEVLINQIKDGIGIVYSQSYRYNEDNEVKGSWITYTDSFGSKLFHSDFRMEGYNFIDRFLIHKNVIPNASAVVFRKDIYQQVGGVDETVKNCSDWLLWMKMLLVSDVAYVAKPLNYFRFHEGSVIATASRMSDPQTYWEVHDKTMRKILKKYLSVFDSQNFYYKDIIKLNDKYILEDEGREAVFEIKKKGSINGYKKLIKASIAGSTLSFMRLLLKNE